MTAHLKGKVEESFNPTDARYFYIFVDTTKLADKSPREMREAIDYELNELREIMIQDLKGLIL